MMIHNSFLFPEILQDTPRLFTAIAEWLAIFVHFYMYKRRAFKEKYAVLCILSLGALVLFHYFAGKLSILFWVPAMMAAVWIMFASMMAVLDIRIMDCGVLTVHAFVLAEFSASLYRQLYVWLVYITEEDNVVMSSLTMMAVYALVYSLYYKAGREHISVERGLNMSLAELMSVIATGLGAFIMGNISFVWGTTPFSVSDGILYVRTLVDFGGLLMLMTQLERHNEIAIKNESAAINQLFQKQYEQYRLAIDSSELFRREMHDMKHFVAALKVENDPAKRGVILEDLEQAIAIQESFMNTGNNVLDVILTTKSLQCEKQGINLNAMVDGKLLNGIYVKDICSIFGNLLDNSIEAAQMVADRDKRLISLSVKKSKQFIVIECENYSENLPDIDDNMLPHTTKKDSLHHGYGLKSIYQVAEKYGGAMNVSAKDGWFTVRVILGI